MESTVRGKRRTRCWRETKYRRTAYGMSTEGKFMSKKVSWLEGIRLRSIKVKRQRVISMDEYRTSKDDNG